MTDARDAATHHRASDPHFAWGLRVLERLALRDRSVGAVAAMARCDEPPFRLDHLRLSIGATRD